MPEVTLDATHLQIRHHLEEQLLRLVQRIGDTAGDRKALPGGRLEAAAIKSALKRLDDGTYDQCSKCGKSIDERRLVALPTTTTCLRCSI